MCALSPDHLEVVTHRMNTDRRHPPSGRMMVNRCKALYRETVEAETDEA